MATSDEFRDALRKTFTDREAAGAPAVTVTSADLHRAVGGYPGPDHSMPTCCSVMLKELDESRGDSIVPPAPPSGKGATLKIRYVLPR